MTDGWGWATPIRERHFRPPLAGGYRLERVDEETYWGRHEDELRRHFPPDAYFDRDALAGEARRAARERVAAAEGAERLADHWLVHAPDGALAGVFSTVQRDAETFQLYHVTLHPDHRGRGLYRELLDRVLAYASELGFSTTISEHAPSNSPVIVRHLKAGFVIVGLEMLDDQFATARAAARRVGDAPVLHSARADETAAPHDHRNPGRAGGA